MKDEMHVLKQNGTWELVPLPARKKAIECRWVYIIKLNPDETLAYLKAHLVAKKILLDIWCRLPGSKKNDFSPVAYFTYCHTLLDSIQLDIKNAFLHSILDRNFI